VNRRTRSPLLAIFLIVLVDVMSMTIMFPLLPFYAEAFGASPLVIGFLFASFAACQLISGPILGNLSDRYGRRPLLLFSQVGSLVSLLVMASAPALWAVFLGRIISGITAGNLTIAQAYITDHTKPENRTRAFGIIGVAFGIGFAIGPAISGWLVDLNPEVVYTHAQIVSALARPLLLAAGLSALSIVATFVLLFDDPPVAQEGDGPPPPAGRRLGILEWRGYAEYFKRPGLARLLVQFFLFSVGFSMFFSGFAMFAERRFTWNGHPFGPREVGWIYAYAGVIGIVIQGGLLRQLSKRFGDAPLVTAGFLFSAVGYVILGAVHTVGLLLVAATVSSIGNSFLRPALTARVTQTVARHEQGVVLGLTQSLQAIAQVFAPALAGLLIEHDQLFVWAALAATAASIGLIAALSARGPSLPTAAPPG